MMLGLNENIDKITMANSVPWHMLKRKDNHVLRKGLKFHVKDQRKKGKPEDAGRGEMQQKIDKNELCQARWVVDNNLIATRRILLASCVKDTTRFKTFISLSTCTITHKIIHRQHSSTSQKHNS